MSTKKDKFSLKDKNYMKLAINLARNQEGFTGNNPPVGCVIVKNNEIVFFVDKKEIYLYFGDLLFVRLQIEVLVSIPFFISLICQLGDLFISYFKRRAKIKNTGNLIPGHGGLLDRIDGTIFALPIGFIIISLF